MREASEYEEQAQECLRMAATMKKSSPAEMAEAWMMLASERRIQSADRGEE
jgi:hypothetical protein